MQERGANANSLCRLFRWLCLSAFILLLSLGAGQSTESSNALSSYTKQLIDLTNLFQKLDKATAERMAANERYLMAKAMLRLSGGFYSLKRDKAQFVRAALRSIEWNNRGAPGMYESAAILQGTLDCLAAQFHKDGSRIGALVGFDGPSVSQQFEVLLEKKADSVDRIIHELGFDPKTPNLTDAIVKDAQAAWDAADALYRKTAEFAHVLDPSVIPPDHPYCERPAP
jgi:hypothetical protein